MEDAAEVFGQKYKKMCGSFGDLSTYSFYANKQITTGEGGMITTNSKKLYEKIKNLKNLSFEKKIDLITKMFHQITECQIFKQL